ncbi:MAG: CoA transferase [Kiloniellales bacterium]|nr:CoA transferase [Kiloniellales bacterium]
MTPRFLPEIETAFRDEAGAASPWSLSLSGTGELPSCFAVTDLAVASIGAAGLTLARYAAAGRAASAVSVDRRLASLWFGWTLHPEGWSLPPAWDPVAGDYPAKDGWIRLHTNAPAHRAAALSVLGVAAERSAVERAVAGWDAAALEAAVVEAGGCAAAMHSLEAWARHPQGRAVAREPLVAWAESAAAPRDAAVECARPLAGVRVLDLTRVLAGPVASRFLAGFGAEVLRIDPPGWEEPGVVPEVTLGKRCAGLDLRVPTARETFESLLASADVLLHGYRPGALPGLGYDLEARRRINPVLVDVSLDAYGWTGPWAGRRGFDSLVQMSSGIAQAGMAAAGATRPVPLPVQALDHATGYLLAAAVIHALGARRRGRILSARLSLARTARLLTAQRPPAPGPAPLESGADDLAPAVEDTAWGPARRLSFPLTIDGIAPHWPHPAGELRSAPAAWSATSGSGSGVD